MKWVPLHVHSQYSILDAAADIYDIAQKAAGLTAGQPEFGSQNTYGYCSVSVRRRSETFYMLYRNLSGKRFLPDEARTV